MDTPGVSPALLTDLCEWPSTQPKQAVVDADLTRKNLGRCALVPAPDRTSIRVGEQARTGVVDRNRPQMKAAAVLQGDTQ